MYTFVRTHTQSSVTGGAEADQSQAEIYTKIEMRGLHERCRQRLGVQQTREKQKIRNKKVIITSIQYNNK